MKRLLLTLITTTIFLTSEGADSLLFHHLTKGLSQNTITKIVQDNDGFLWFGTRCGLHKYDGQVFEVFYNNHDDSTSLSNCYISDMVMDNHDKLWVGTATGGINIYDKGTNSFEHLSHDPNNPNTIGSDLISCLLFDSRGNVWVGTEDAGVTMINPRSGEYFRFRHNDADPYSLPSNYIFDIEEDQNGNLWIGTWGAGLSLFDRATGRFITFNTKNRPGLQSDIVRAIYSTKSGIWVGTQRGICNITYDDDGKYLFEKLNASKSSHLAKKLHDLPVISIMEDRNGILWLGTENGGLFLYQQNTNSLDHYPHAEISKTGISSNSIWSIYQDEASTVWIGTFNNGINKVDPYQQKFKHEYRNPAVPNSLSYNVVSSFAEVPGGIWIGTDGGGLNYLDKQSETFTQFKHEESNPRSLSSDAVLDLFVDSEENLWVATYKGGVNLKRPGKPGFENLTTETVDSNGFLGNDIFKIFEDDRSNIWFLVYREGISIYLRESNTYVPIRHIPGNPLSLSGNKVRAVLQTGKREFWIGTEYNGIDILTIDDDYNVVSKKNLTYKADDPGSLNSKMVTLIKKDSRGRIWVGTFGDGLSIYNENNNSFSSVLKSENVSGNLVVSFQEDTNGDIWAGTYNGLYKINGETLEILNYDELDGLQGSEFYKGSSLLASNGELYFGGINGYNHFFPNDVRKNSHVPKVRITEFEVIKNEGKESKLDGINVYDLDEVNLAYDQNNFSIRFAVLNYSQPEKNLYAYKLENFDKDWIYGRNINTASYTNIPYGKYEFKVKGANNDGVWNQVGASIPVVINSPWWLSWVALAVYSCIFVCFFIWFRHAIISREKLRSQFQLDHMELNKMQELDEMKSRFFTNIYHEFRTPLTLIVGPLKSLLNDTYTGNPKNQYRVIERNAERLLRLINQLLDLSKLESGTTSLKVSRVDIVQFLKPILYSFTSYAERQYINFKCEFPDRPIYLYFEKDKLEKAIVNLVSNAFKYTPEFGSIKVSVDTVKEGVMISVSDTGIGIPEEKLSFIFNRFYRVDNRDIKGTGIGLALTKEIVDIHKGEIEVKSELGKGSVFMVTLKTGTDHFEKDEIVDQEVQTPANDSEPNFISVNPDKQTDFNRSVNNEETEDEGLPLILVAEDDEDMRSFICEYLVTNYQVIEASDGEMAFMQAKEQFPDLIVSDVMMPKMNGYELCRSIKDDIDTSHIPVILLTAKASNESAIQGFETGADYYVTKPFNPKLLELRINNILKSRTVIRERILGSDAKMVNLEPKELKLESKDQEFLKQIIKCIEINISKSEFGVDQLCKEAGLSRTQLYRKLKGLVGQSANEFVRSFRLKRAAQLLKQQKMTIAEVTYQVGFNDLQYFRYCFKKQFGVNPSEYGQNTT